MTQLVTQEDGATLIEQLMTLLIGAVLITSLYAYFRGELYRVLALETKTAALQDARGALDIMVRDLTNAGSWAGTTVPLETSSGADDPDHDADAVCNRVYAASPSLIHVQMDLNGNDNCSDVDPRENFRYELTGPTATCPGTHIIRRNGDCLIANVTPASSGKIFTYYDANGAELGASPPLSMIKRVKIAFSVRMKNPDPKNPTNLISSVSTSVEFRN